MGKVGGRRAWGGKERESEKHAEKRRGGQRYGGKKVERGKGINGRMDEQVDG